MNLVVAADRSHLAVLQGAQQLGLQGEGHFANLIQQQGAAVGLLEQASAVFAGAGIGAGGVAKELAFHQLAGDAAAVDDHIRSGLATALLVHGAGNQFLAGAAFALNKHRAIGVCHLADVLKQPPHHAALADDAVKLLHCHDGAVALHFTAQAAIFQQAACREQEVVHFQRFGKKVVGALLQRLHGLLYRAKCGDDQHCRGRVQALRDGQQAQAVGAGQAQVADQQINIALLQQRLSCFGTGAGAHPVALGFQFFLQQFAQPRIVFDQQQMFGVAHALFFP